MFVDFNIINQLGSPSINSNTFANRPAAGQTGRLFVSTDTFEIYRDNGTGWDLIGGPGAGTITGTGTATQVAYFTGAQTIGSSANLFWDNTAGALGINTATPGAELDVHGTGTIVQVNATGATSNAYLTFQRTGTGVWRIGDTYNGGNNFFELHNTVLTIDALEFEAATNKSTFLGQQTYASGLATGNQFTYNLTVPNGVNITSPNAVHAVNSYLNLSLGGNTTVPAGARQGLEGNSRISFTGAGTLTMTQAATVRAFSALSSVYSFAGSAVGTVTHLAGLRICFPDNIGSAINITNNYGLLLNDQTAGLGTVTYTNRWGIYQEGASDLNYFNGNLLVKTTTNAGFAADINGTARVQGATNIGTGTQSGATLFLNKTITGNISSYGIYQRGTVQSDVTSNTFGYRNDLFTQASAFTLSAYYHYFASQQSIGATSAVTNQYGYAVESTLTGATNNFAFWGGIASGANRWNLYMQGTALNYLAGNLLLNTTTDAGFRLDCNGTARVQGNITQTGVNTSSLGYIRNDGTLGLVSNPPSASIIGILIGSVSNGGHTAIFTKGNNPGSTAIRVTDQNIGASVNHFLVDSVGSSGFGLASGTTSVAASAIVEIVSTTKGFLPPRMTTAQKNAIAAPAAGLTIYDTTLNKLCVFTGVNWETVTSV